MTWTESAIGKFFDRALVTPLLNFLKQGLSPQKLALSVALGLALGTFPMLGVTTLLCTAAAFMFRLNMPAIQLVNYFALVDEYAGDCRMVFNSPDYLCSALLCPLAGIHPFRPAKNDVTLFISISPSFSLPYH